MNSFDKTFEENTLLNRIVPDLQLIIWEYFKTFPTFVIGKYRHPSYIGYRMIRKKDLYNDTFKNKFTQCYGKCRGLQSIDSLEGSILCGRGFVISYEAYALRCTLTKNIYPDEFMKIEKNDYISFRTSAYYNNDLYCMDVEMLDYFDLNTFDSCKLFKKIGLYVIEDKN